MQKVRRASRKLGLQRDDDSTGRGRLARKSDEKGVVDSEPMVSNSQIALVEKTMVTMQGYRGAKNAALGCESEEAR